MRYSTRVGKSVLLLIVVCAVLTAAVGVGAGLLLGRRAGGSKAGQGAAKKAKKEVVQPATIFSLGEMVVNLADTDSLRYVKINVALGIKEKIAEEKLKESAPLLRDVVIDVLTGKRFDELHREGGARKLKVALKSAAAKRLPNVTLVDVYFESFAMQ